MAVYELLKTRYLIAKQNQAWHINDLQLEVWWVDEKIASGDAYKTLEFCSIRTN